MPKNGITVQQIDDSIGRHAGTLSMQSQLRQAMFDAINADDVAQIVKKQVEKAKNGDEKSLQFVMKYVLGTDQPVKLQQIVCTDVETAARLAKSGAINNAEYR